MTVDPPVPDRARSQASAGNGPASTPLHRFWRRLLGDDLPGFGMRRGHPGHDSRTRGGDAVDQAASDVATLLRSFATSVIAMHEDAQQRALALVASAEAHARDVVDLAYRRADRMTMEAEARLAQADAVLREARARANAIVAEAQQAASRRPFGSSATVVPLSPRGEGKALGR
jgi:hypothetical protein